MLYLVRYSTELCLLILRLRLVDDVIPSCGLRLVGGIIPSCKSFPALSLQVSLAFLVLLGHVTSLLSRRIVYSIYYNSTLLLPVREEGRGCCLVLTVVGENKKCYIITAYKG